VTPAVYLDTPAMTEPADGAESCDPQLLAAAAPSHTWTLDQLTAVARAEHAALLAEERSTTARYWRLGQVLRLARKQFAHGQWTRYLQELCIEKTRAVKALRIFESFTTEAQTVPLTVAEAYAKRRRRPRTARKHVAATQAPQPSAPAAGSLRSWSEFAATIVNEVERRFDEAEFMTAEEVAAALAEVVRAATALRRLEERLERPPVDLNRNVSQNAHG